MLLRGNLPESLHVGSQAGFDVSGLIEIAARQRGDENRLRTDGTDFIHIAGHVSRIGGDVGFTIRSLARLIIVSELDEIIITMEGKRRLPVTLGSEALGAATVECGVDAVHPVGQKTCETKPPSQALGDGGITHQDYLGPVGSGRSG